MPSSLRRFRPHSRSGSRSGLALLAVLACVILLTILAVAYISFTKLNRSSAAEYSQSLQAQEIAHGGLQDILNDLHSEIIAGSINPSTGTYTINNETIYVPTTNLTAVPARIGYPANNWTTNLPSTGTSTLIGPTLVRVSRASDTFFTAPPANYSAANLPNAKWILNRASAASTSLASANGRSISAARWNKSYLLAGTLATVPTDFTASPPDWVYVTRTGSRVCAASELGTSPGLKASTSSLTQNYGTITAGSNPPVSPVVGRYAFIVYDEGALLDANVAGSPTALMNAGTVATSGTAPPAAPTYTDPNTGRSLTFNGKSYQSFVDLYQIPGLNTPAGQTAINAMVNLRNAGGMALANSSNGNTFLGAVFNYTPASFLSYATSTATPATADTPFLNRQDLINYFANIDSNINTASATTSKALPYLGTFSRAVSAPSYTPPQNSNKDPNYQASMGTAVAYKDNAENQTGGIANRDLANVRFANTGTITHYYDDQTGSLTPTGTATYIVNAGDPLLQNRFSLAKIAWLTQSWTGDPGTTSSSYAGSNYPAAIQACFGLVWEPPGNFTTTTANGGNSCWNYVGSPVGPGGTVTGFNGTIETLDQVAKENREPNFFELLKAAILSGSLGLCQGPAAFANGSDNSIQDSWGAPFDCFWASNYKKADLQGSASLFSNTFGTATPLSVQVPQQVPDMQIMQIGANIIDQATPNSYPTAIYFRYSTVSANGKDYDPVSNSAIQNAVFGPVTMVYGDKNLPELSKIVSAMCSPDPGDPNAPNMAPYGGTPQTGSQPTLNDNTHSMEGWLQPELWNPHQQPATALPGVPHNFEIRAYGYAQTWANEGSFLAPDQTPPNGWSGGITAPASPSNWTWSNSNVQAYFPGVNSTEICPAGTLDFTDGSLTSSFYSYPRTLVANDGSGISGLTSVTSSLTTPGSGSAAGTTPTNVALSTFPYYNTPFLVNFSFPDQVSLTNHFVAFSTGVISETPGTSPQLPFFIGSTAANTPISSTNAPGSIGGIDFPIGTNGVEGASFALGWKDSNNRFHPYSFITGAFMQAYLTNYSDSGHPPDGRVGSTSPLQTEQGSLTWGLVDPRTSRIAMSGNFVIGGAGPDSSMFPDNYNTGYPNVSAVGGMPSAASIGNFVTPIPKNMNGGSGYPEDWMMNSTATLTTPSQRVSSNDPRLTTTPSTPAYYADPDGVVRPADGYYSNVSTGDGIMLFTSYNSLTSTALGDAKKGTAADDLPADTTNSSGNNRHGRRPVILNRPFRSVGELGYVFRDLPFKTLDFFSPSSADAALLDVFSLTDESQVGGSQMVSVVPGQVDLSYAPFPVIEAILSGGSKKDVDPTYNISGVSAFSNDTLSLSKTISAYLQPTGTINPLLNRAGLVTQIQNAIQSVSAGTIVDTSRSAAALKYDQYNKSYLEAPVRALADMTSTRTWNLMIDIIAQSGQMSPSAQPGDTNALSEFIVQGEKRYWLHVAIDRYTGKIVAQQLEPVYE